MQSGRGRRNLKALGKFLFVLLSMVVFYSILFHVLMLREGQEHTWLTGLYWTLTVMSTLGFGDITFHTDLGRLYSIVVLLSGTTFMRVLLPFTFIEFFYQPWMAAQAAARAPRTLPPKIRGHVLLTNHDVVTSALIRRLDQYQYEYALIVPEVEDALRLHDLGIKVLVGELDDPETWKQGRVAEASLVATTSSDVINTNVALTVRGIADELPIITTASDQASVDIMGLAGSSFVLQMEELIGNSFAAQSLGGDAMSHVIGGFGVLLIAEATARGTPLVGRTIRENQVREKIGVAVVGVWERGRFESPTPDTMIRENTILVLAGSKQSLDAYNELFCIYNVSTAPAVIIGGGRVGRATARALARKKMDYRIVEMLPERIPDSDKYVQGSAADLAVLEAAGIREAPTVIITPHDDDMNVYLTVYCRKLRPDIQIQSRATQERNVAALHRAGADSVLSYASIGASAIMNMLRGNRILMVAEGLDLFEVRVPDQLVGRAIGESSIRERTGCSIVAIHTDAGMQVVPDPSVILAEDAEIVLIGTAESEERFLGLYAR
ncbi:MAG: potassium channel protein [Gemmatimonadetes bacterium]|nr:potassium channel protein [Gemmatimonadota bacterium]